jgi:hypothetical protein
MHALCEGLAPAVPKWRITNLLSLAYGLNAQQEAAVDVAFEGKMVGQQQHQDTGTDLPQFPSDNLVKAAQIWVCNGGENFEQFNT